MITTQVDNLLGAHAALQAENDQLRADVTRLRALLARGADLVTEHTEPSSWRADWIEQVRRELMPMR